MCKSVILLKPSLKDYVKDKLAEVCCSPERMKHRIQYRCMNPALIEISQPIHEVIKYLQEN